MEDEIEGNEMLLNDLTDLSDDEDENELEDPYVQPTVPHNRHKGMYG